MTIEEKVHSALIAAGGVTALVPVSRIRTPGILQNVTRPYIVHFPVSVDPIETHDGPATMKIWDYYQVSVYSDLYSNGVAVANAVVAALDTNHATFRAFWRPGGWYIGQDPDLGIFHFAINFRIAEF